MAYPLTFLSSGLVYIYPSDDCAQIAGALEASGYDGEHCLSLDFAPDFVARLMAAGFLVMSLLVKNDRVSKELKSSKEEKRYLLMPKHHLVRSCLFFPELHIKKSIRQKLPEYDLVFDRDFDVVLDKCVAIHGDDWLTEPLVNVIRDIRVKNLPVKPVSFALYRRDGKLVAGEFGIVSGRVYTSYSGYYEEDNAGTVQMILTARYLEKNGFAFWDLGMPLDYKLTLGAEEISRKAFLRYFNMAQLTPPSS